MSKNIKMNDEMLQYMGRIDKSEEDGYWFVFPYSSVSFKVKTTKLSIMIKNCHSYWDNYIGFVIDGKQGRVKIADTSKEQSLIIAENMEDCVHEVMIFKRQDGCHYFLLKEIVVDDNAVFYKMSEKPKRRIEIYGDSVSAGEVSEAVAYVGKEDPEHTGEYSNSYYSYGAITARTLNAELHDIAQGGIALLPGTGWYEGPDYTGMEEVYDKIQYEPKMMAVKKWDFSAYTPQVVIIAIGQNDNHPIDFMKEDYEGELSRRWREHYQCFVEQLRSRYPKAEIILTTTILQHDPSWDRAIETVCLNLHDAHVTHFLYSKNGIGTPGHVRIPEAEEMAAELTEYINSLGQEIWER